MGAVTVLAERIPRRVRGLLLGLITTLSVNAVYITFHEAGARTDKPAVPPA